MAKRLHLVHVKSSVADKAPSASAVTYGEIAINYNEESPAIYIKDDADNMVKFIAEPYFEKIVGTGITENDGVTITPLTQVIEEDEETVSAALNDLNTRKADKDYVDEAISSITITVDDHLDSASTNPVENRLIYRIVAEDEKIIATSLTDLDRRKADKEYVDEAISSATITVDGNLDSASTNPVENRVIYDAIIENEEITANALIDLDQRKADKEYVDDSLSSKGNAKIFYGTCDTLGSATTKTVECSAFTSNELVVGAVIYVTFKNTNSGAVASLTLNVNETGEYPIKKIYNYAYANLTSAAEIYSSMTQSFVFNGNFWVVQGLDVNSTYTLQNLPEGNGHYIADSNVYRYQMLFQRGGENFNKLTPLNNANNNTGSTKSMLTGVTFDPFGKIYVYSTTAAIAGGSYINGTYLCYHYQNLNLRYTFNVPSTFTTNTNVYLKVSPQEDGTVKLADETGITQDLPTTNDGFWYIFLGRTTPTGYSMSLYTEHPVYMHDGTEIIEIISPKIVNGLKNQIGVEIDDHLDSASTNPVENRVIYDVIVENEEITANALVDLDNRKADKEYVDEAVSSITFTVDDHLDSASTNPVENRAIYDWIVEDEKTISAAINDVNDRKADKTYVDDEIASALSSILPPFSSADAGKVLSIDSNGRLIWVSIS